MTAEYDDVLIQLEPLYFTPARTEAAARSGLQDFLDEATRLRPSVSARPSRRLTIWMPQLRLRVKFTQERSPMFALAFKLVLVLAVMLGGAGVSAAAAQNSLPNEPLYPVKLMIEDVQAALAADPDAQIDAQLEQAQQRVREMAQLVNRGAAIPAEVTLRLQTQLQTALQIAAHMEDQSMQAALDRIQLRTQDQSREMERLQLHEPAQMLTQAREMAQLGLRDPQLFRQRFGHSRHDAAPPQAQMTPRADPSHTPARPQASVTPQATRTPQPQVTNTPQNRSDGPGPQSTSQPVATPIGQGSGHEYGPGPQPTNAPDGGGEPQGHQDGLGGNGPGPEPGGSDNGGGSGGSGSGGGGGGSGSGGGKSLQR
jgi:uncharacterized membrane protein YgcG